MKRSGWTLIDLLIVTFVVHVTVFTWGAVTHAYGTWWGIGAGLCAGSLSVTAAGLFYYGIGALYERGLRKARERYREIYRVIADPTDPKIIVIPEGAEIRVGDYGWEAGPARNDGLIYLQGLTRRWKVVWHAGLRPDEIEHVGPKAFSQYDSWYPYWADPPPLPPCPFPVVKRKTTTIGRPHHSHTYFVAPTPYRPRKAPTEGEDGEKPDEGR